MRICYVVYIQLVISALLTILYVTFGPYCHGNNKARPPFISAFVMHFSMIGYKHCFMAG